MKKILLVLLTLLSLNQIMYAKKELGKATLTLNNGTVINGYCEDMLKHERREVKISSLPDGKKQKNTRLQTLVNFAMSLPAIQSQSIGILSNTTTHTP